jgi:hexokinase
MPMGKGFAITSNLNLGKLLLAGYERHITSPSSNGVSPDAQLNKPAKRRKIERLPRLKIAAITNDTVATLASLAYTVKSRPNSRVAMGLIVGTGTNATIPMKLTDLHPSKRSQLRLPQASDLKDVEIVVNTEWTINGTAPPLKKLGFITKWDKVLDEASEAPGFQPFEYMTAGRYLGELARLITLDFITGKLGVQEVDLPPALRRRNALTTTFLATVVAPSRSSILLLPQLRKLLPAPEHSGWQWSTDEAEVLRKVARLVQKRSAGLIASAIIGLLGCTGELELKDERSLDPSIPNGAVSHVTDNKLPPQGDIEDLVVAFSGGTISRYPEFLRSCQGFIDELLSKEASRGTSENNRNRTKSIILKEAVDGGIIGAGVLAGTACA